MTLRLLERVVYVGDTDVVGERERVVYVGDTERVVYVGDTEVVGESGLCR